MMMISHDELTSILNYDPTTGVFTWAKPRPKIHVGDVAGYRHHKGYLCMEISGKYYAQHRLAWFYVHGRWPAAQIDHINRQRDDNRIENLREATNGQNRANSKNSNKTGLKGVRRQQSTCGNILYVAHMTVNKKVVYLGCFETAEQAHTVYAQAALRVHGEFANP